MPNIEIKNMGKPDETRTLPKTEGQVVKVGEYTIMRGTLQPGWKWSECVKPTVGTDSCQVHHVVYAISGRMKVRMNDGTEKEFGPGDAGVIPPGHDAWVVGNEPFVSVDFTGGATYGKK
jgi:mannose-6-phosphate isomerase-like protein (cupin superfamily)